MVEDLKVFLCDRRSMPLAERAFVTVHVHSDDTMADLAARATRRFVDADPSLGHGETVTSHVVAVHPVLDADSGLFYDVAEAVYFGIDDFGSAVYTSGPAEMLYRHFARAEREVDRHYDPRRLAMGRLGGTGGDEFVFVNIVSWLNDNGLASATLSALSTAVVQKAFPGGVPTWASKQGREATRVGDSVRLLLAEETVDVVLIEQWFCRQQAWDDESVAKQLKRTQSEVRWLLLRMGYRQPDVSGMWVCPASGNEDRKRWTEILHSDQPADYKIDW